MGGDQIQALFDAVPEAGVLVEFADGEPIVRTVNDAFEDCFGYDADAVRGECLNDFVVPDDPEQTRLASEIDAAAANGESVEAEVVRQTVEGPRHFLFRASPFENAGTVKSIGIYVDVTQRKRDRRRYERLIEQSSDIITILEPDGTIQYESPSIESILGYDPEALVGENAFEYVHPEDVDEVAAEFTRGLQDSDATPKAEYRFRAADGSWRILESIGSNYIERPEVEGFVVTSRDVTERKRRERELERQNERLDEFASIISHDLRNPLNVAEGRLAMVEEETNSEHVGAVQDALDRIKTIVDDTLTLARQGRTIEEPTRFEFDAVVDEAWESVETGDAELVRDERVGPARGDADRVQELLENLFRNAVVHGTGESDSGPDGPAGESLTVRVGPDDGGFYVADDGVGIPEADRDQIFESGFTTSTEGTGFGLAIVEEIAEAHGWAIDVAESADGGARFEFTDVETPKPTGE
jgi:PAS domain S-box-containing protein